MAQFTAYSVERFHKTAELLLIKPRRSTVNEADSLVQLTKILSTQIGSIANLYCNQLNDYKNIEDEKEKSEVNSSITTINLEVQILNHIFQKIISIKKNVYSKIFFYRRQMRVHTSKKHLGY